MGYPLREYEYCPFCREPLVTEHIEERDRPSCPSCRFVQWKNPVVGVAVVAFLEGELVLVRSAQSGYLHGQWCIPCGHVEYREHVRDAARREFAEETGLEAELGEVYHVDSNFFEPWGRNSVGIWFEGEIVGGELRPGGDALDARTWPLTDLPAELCYKSDMRVIRKLCRERGRPVPEFEALEE